MQPKYLLVVKGDSFNAIFHAHKRGISAIVKQTMRTEKETILYTSTATFQQLADWMVEDQGKLPPFPIGSLLYFQEIKYGRIYLHPYAANVNDIESWLEWLGADPSMKQYTGGCLNIGIGNVAALPEIQRSVDSSMFIKGPIGEWLGFVAHTDTESRNARAREESTT